MKKNIPGKYTTWERDSDEEGSKARAEWFDPDASDPEKEMTEMEKQKKWIDADCPEPVRRTIMARQEKVSVRYTGACMHAVAVACFAHCITHSSR